LPASNFKNRKKTPAKFANFKRAFNYFKFAQGFASLRPANLQILAVSFGQILCRPKSKFNAR